MHITQQKKKFISIKSFSHVNTDYNIKTYLPNRVRFELNLTLNLVITPNN